MSTIKEFVDGFKSKKIINTHIAPNAVAEYIKKELEVKDYVPFAEKRELCANVLNACNTKDGNGLVKVDSVSRYILFTIAIISTCFLLVSGFINSFILFILCFKSFFSIIKAFKIFSF